MALPLAAVGLGLTALKGGADLANMYYTNKFQKRQAEKENRMRAEEFAQQKAEYDEEKMRQIKAQKLADLFSNASWMGDKNKERIQQNYKYYMDNGI